MNLIYADATLQEFLILTASRRLRWLDHLARTSDERLPKGMLFGHMEGSGFKLGTQSAVLLDKGHLGKAVLC